MIIIDRMDDGIAVLETDTGQYQQTRCRKGHGMAMFCNGFMTTMK